MLKLLRFFIGGLAAVLLLPTALVFGQPVQGVLERPALMARAPEKRVLIDVTLTAGRLVAVGERGIIIYSDDAGETWQQAEVPVSVSLTAVSFTSARNGFAVGHGGVVLHTADGGETWARKLEGTAVAQMAFENAVARLEREPDNFDAQQMMNNAELLLEDGPDKPFLDLCFKNDQEGLIVGAYGLAFKTEDGGESWQCLMDSIENTNGLNLYAIQAAGDVMYIAGEQGLFLVSRDGGQSFQPVETPYFGTFFDMMAYPTGELVLVGLQGNAYWSSDEGQTFTRSEAGGGVSFTRVTRCEHDVLVFANQGGMLLESRDRGKTIRVLNVPRMNPVCSLVQIPSTDHSDHVVMTVGYGGAVRVQLPSDSDKGGQP